MLLDKSKTLTQKSVWLVRIGSYSCANWQETRARVSGQLQKQTVAVVRENNRGDSVGLSLSGSA